MKVVFSAEREYMEPHAVPLLAHHFGQVAVDHACKRRHKQPWCGPHQCSSCADLHKEAEYAFFWFTKWTRLDKTACC